jgi:hypothetical protein
MTHCPQLLNANENPFSVSILSTHGAMVLLGTGAGSGGFDPCTTGRHHELRLVERQVKARFAHLDTVLEHPPTQAAKADLSAVADRVCKRPVVIQLHHRGSISSKSFCTSSQTYPADLCGC